MVLKNFRLNCIARVICIGLSLLLGVWLVLSTQFMISALVIFALILLQTVDLVNYVERTNVKIAKLISAIENEDFSQQFYDDRKSEGNKDLLTALNKVVDRFGEARKSREEALYFLQTVMDHSPVALMVCEKQGRIAFYNKALSSFLDGKKHSHISELAGEYPELVQAFMNPSGPEPFVIRSGKDSPLKNLSLRSGTFGLYGKTLTVMSIQNIGSEMEEKELESWQKLMRVLTHEIMNSVTPITSLAETTANMLRETGTENKKEVIQALETIQKRSLGLLHFTRTYRSVTRLPVPQPGWELPMELLETVERLFENQLKENNICLEVTCTQHEKILCDARLMEQVLLNLVLNSIQALEMREDGKTIKINCSRLKNRTCITVSDNGTGIPEEYRDKIFVPFFTSKKSGNGIGLSLCRQLMRLQGGSIRLDTSTGEGTRMLLLI